MRLRALATADENKDGGWRRGVGLGLLLFVGTLLLYARTAGFDFIHFDDDVFVFENPHVNGGLTWKGIAWAFGRPDIDYWRPLTWISHMVDVELFGLKAGGHHLASVIWHAANAVLLFAFLMCATGRRGSAFAVAALFAWHPLHVESVAWIAERKDVMCAFFWFGTLLFYARYGRSGRRGDYVAALVSFAIGLSCKPMIITLPFQLLLLDVWPLRRWSGVAEVGRPTRSVGRLLGEKVPFLLLTLVGAVGVVWAQSAVGALKSTADYSLLHRVGNSLVAYLGYLERMAWPVDLVFFYEHERVLDSARVLLAGSVVGGLSVFAVLSVRRLPALFSGWFWFLGTLVPVIGLVQVGDQAMADRYTYVALTGVFWMIAFGCGRLTDTWPGLKLPLLAGLALVLAGAGWQTHRQLTVWRNSETLFQHAIRIDPDNRMALNNLAYLHFSREEFGPAADLYRRYVEVDPASDRAHYNLAEIYERTGQPAEAAVHWRRLVELAPDFAVAWSGLVRSSIAAGNLTGALAASEAALMQLPEDPGLLLQFAEIFRESGQGESVKGMCRAVLTRRPRDFAVHALLLAELRRGGDETAALTATDRLVELFPQAAEAHYHAALVCGKFGHEVRARDHLNTALQLNPAFATARLELGRLMAMATDPQVSDPAAARALVDGAEKALGMTLPQTLEIRAELAWRSGSRAEAVALLKAAIERAVEMQLPEPRVVLERRLAEMEKGLGGR